MDHTGRPALGNRNGSYLCRVEDTLSLAFGERGEECGDRETGEADNYARIRSSVRGWKR